METEAKPTARDADLIARMASGTELLLADAMAEGFEGTVADKADLLIALDALKRAVGSAIAFIETDLAESTDAGELLRGDRLVKRDKRVSMTEAKNEELLRDVLRHSRVDRETGEMRPEGEVTPGDIIVALNKTYTLTLHTARKGALKGLGINPRDYATVTETPIMKVV